MLKVKQTTKDLVDEISLDNHDRIVIILRGAQTGPSVHALATRMKGMIEILKTNHKKINVLVDLTNISPTNNTSEARLETKAIFRLPIDMAAVVGRPYMAPIMSYMFRFISGRSTMRFFTNPHKAELWLSGKTTKRTRGPVGLVSGIIVGTIGLTTLLGWQIDNPYLTRWLTTLRPMNPLAAIGLVIIGFGFCSYWANKMRPIKIAGVFGILMGIAALLPLHIDNLLYGGRLASLGSHTGLADSAALCFIAVGISPFTIGTTKRAIRMLQYLLGTVIIGLALFNIFGQLYAHDYIYGLSDSFVMAFNLAIAFLAIGITLILLVLYRQANDVLDRVSRIGWLIVLALIGMQILAYGLWYQTQARNNNDSSQAFVRRTTDLDRTLDQRVQAYIDALYGFKGLFAASDQVSQGEFQAYYNSIDLNKAYPGIRALSFISKVSNKDLNGFVAKQRKDTSLHPVGNPGFNITSQTNLPTHYILTYNASNSNTVGGTDLGSVPARLQAYEKADNTGAPVASSTISFAASATQPAQKGFFITIPVASKADSHTTVGFVNAVFSYTDFFAKTFGDNSSLEGIALTLHSADGSKDGTIFQSANYKGTSKFSYSNSIRVADSRWIMNITAPAGFGISQSQVELPAFILVGGQLFSLLLLVIFTVQGRAKRQALDLADRITEDLQEERNLAVANDQKSTAILASIGDAVFVVDRKGHIILFNPAAARISGYSAHEALGRPYQEILRFVLEKDHKPSHTFIKRAFEGHTTSMSNHTLLVRKDGREISVADSAAPIHNANGAIEGIIVVFRDVSKEEALDKAKTEFVSLASHQLRTPLSAINWYSEMLLDGDAGEISKDQREYLQEIYNGNQRMVELVDSLLNVSRLEVGKLKNDPQPTSMQELAASLQKEMETSRRAKQLTIDADIEKTLPTVFADPKLLRMIIQNLLSNAIKYTANKGNVKLTMRTATGKDISGKLHAGHYVFVSVADTGYGIPEVQQDKIFQKLFRADNVRKMDVEGTGLGLYIVKEVAEKLGGTIWFESMESVGTTFYVIIPVKTKPS